MMKHYSTRFIVLDSWRGIAALCVAFGHLKTDGILTSLSISSMTFRLVDLFFLLSGFVIAFSNSEKLTNNKEQVKIFLIRRFFRLWPLHIFVLFFFFLHQTILFIFNETQIINSPKAFTSEFSPTYLIPNIFMVQAWGFITEPSWNKPSWSISTELFAYIFFGWICTHGRFFSFYLVLFVTVSCFVFCVVRPETMVSTNSLALIRCMAGFGMGICAFHLYNHIKHISIRFPTSLESITIFLLFYGIINIPADYGAYVLPIFLLVVLVFSFEQGFFSNLLNSQVFIFLGKISYSIYLIHSIIALFIYSIASVFGMIGKTSDGSTAIVFPNLLNDLVIVFFLLIVIALSRFSYILIEIPGQKIGIYFSNKAT